MQELENCQKENRSSVLDNNNEIINTTIITEKIVQENYLFYQIYINGAHAELKNRILSSINKIYHYEQLFCGDNSEVILSRNDRQAFLEGITSKKGYFVDQTYHDISKQLKLLDQEEKHTSADEFLTSYFGYSDDIATLQDKTLYRIFMEHYSELFIEIDKSKLAIQKRNKREEQKQNFNDYHFSINKNHEEFNNNMPHNIEGSSDNAGVERKQQNNDPQIQVEESFAKQFMLLTFKSNNLIKGNVLLMILVGIYIFIYLAVSSFVIPVFLMVTHFLKKPIESQNEFIKSLKSKSHIAYQFRFMKRFFHNTIRYFSRLSTQKKQYTNFQLKDYLRFWSYSAVIYLYLIMTPSSDSNSSGTKQVKVLMGFVIVKSVFSLLSELLLKVISIKQSSEESQKQKFEILDSLDINSQTFQYSFLRDPLEIEQLFQLENYYFDKPQTEEKMKLIVQYYQKHDEESFFEFLEVIKDEKKLTEFIEQNKGEYKFQEFVEKNNSDGKILNDVVRNYKKSKTNLTTDTQKMYCALSLFYQYLFTPLKLPLLDLQGGGGTDLSYLWRYIDRYRNQFLSSMQKVWLSILVGYEFVRTYLGIFIFVLILVNFIVYHKLVIYIDEQNSTLTNNLTKLANIFFILFFDSECVSLNVLYQYQNSIQRLTKLITYDRSKEALKRNSSVIYDLPCINIFCHTSIKTWYDMRKLTFRQDTLKSQFAFLQVGFQFFAAVGLIILFWPQIYSFTLKQETPCYDDNNTKYNLIMLILVLYQIIFKSLIGTVWVFLDVNTSYFRHIQILEDILDKLKQTKVEYYDLLKKYDNLVTFKSQMFEYLQQDDMIPFILWQFEAVNQIKIGSQHIFREKCEQYSGFSDVEKELVYQQKLIKIYEIIINNLKENSRDNQLYFLGIFPLNKDYFSKILLIVIPYAFTVILKFFKNISITQHVYDLLVYLSNQL